MQPFIKNVEAALHDLRQGKMIVLTDHPDRENEGDLICAAEIITPEMINFMIRNCSGIICLPLTEMQFKKLGLSLMVPPHENNSHRGTPFTISIEAKAGISTGVSAKDRATTILTAVKETACSDDIVKPGHIFPLLAKEGGVLERQGHTEGAIDLVRLAGYSAAAVLCEVMNADGTMAHGKQLSEFAMQHQLKILSIDDLIAYRRCNENLIADEAAVQLVLEPHGAFHLSVIKEKITGNEHIVLTKERKNPEVATLVRIHSSCITGDLFGSTRCDCNKQLDFALQRISKEGGVLIYLNQEGRGIGLFNKIKAYSLQENGFDTVDANTHLGLPIDSREYYIAANWLKNNNITDIELLTNNHHKSDDLKKFGIDSVKMTTMPIFCNEKNKFYLQTKKEKLNHAINCDWA